MLIYISRRERYVPLAQPDRVFGYEPKGRGFESLMARHKGDAIASPFLFIYIVVNVLQNGNKCDKIILLLHSLGGLYEKNSFIDACFGVDY